MAARGPYAKGAAKRREILESALSVVADQGYRRASVRDIAAAAGMSPAGLLHHFGTRDDLFVAIIAARDDRDFAAFADEPFFDALLAVVRMNATVPGLVYLYAQLAVEAGDPEHPARDYFRERSRRMRGPALAAVKRAQAEGRMRSDLDPAWVLRATQAIVDGLQNQWIVDHTVDMAGDLARFLELLKPS